MEEETAARFRKDSTAFFSRMNRVSRRCTDLVLEGLPKCHFGILHRVAAAIHCQGTEGCISMSDLTRSLDDVPQAVSRWLRILEQDGLAERLTDPADRRKTLVRLTPTGQAAHTACANALEAFAARVAQRMGPERLHQLYADLNELLEAMEAEAGSCQNE